MGQILVAVATKIGVALAEAIILRLVWQLWAAYGQRLRTAVAAPAV
jgi:cytochrome b